MFPQFSFRFFKIQPFPCYLHFILIPVEPHINSLLLVHPTWLGNINGACKCTRFNSIKSSSMIINYKRWFNLAVIFRILRVQWSNYHIKINRFSLSNIIKSNCYILIFVIRAFLQPHDAVPLGVGFLRCRM